MSTELEQKRERIAEILTDYWQPNPYEQGTRGECRARALAAENVAIVLDGEGLAGDCPRVYPLIEEVKDVS